MGKNESTRLLSVNDPPTSESTLVELFIRTDDGYVLKCFRFICLILGPVVMIPFMFDILDEGNPQISRCAGVTLWMAIWWMSEAVDITITSLLPLVLFPMLGLLPPTAVAKAFFSDLSFLLIGTICFSITMAKWNLHKRFALKILTIVGTNPSAVLFGFMFCTYFTSWWLQNTATTVMMLPVARAVLESIQASERLEDRSAKLRLLSPQTESKGDMARFSTAILLAVAYSASIGGLATLTGTATNLVFAAQVRNLFPDYGEVSFAQWMAYCVPLSFILLLSMWVIFYFRYTRGVSVYIDSEVIKKKYREMGSFTFEEAAVAFLLLLTIFLWIFRNPPGCSEEEGCGWEELFHVYRGWYGEKSEVLSDTTAVLFTALFLFFIPAKNAEPGTKLLSWEQAQAGIPWEILLLIGSGLALAEAFAVNNFNDFIASKLTGLNELSPYLIVFLISISITTLTEFTSNTAVASITLPVIASVAVAIRVNPFFLMMPTVIACSFAFCLPVSSPPNAMVANSGGVKVREMLKTGIWLNLVAVLLNLAWMAAGKSILGIDLDVFPPWAEPTI